MANLKIFFSLSLRVLVAIFIVVRHDAAVSPRDDDKKWSTDYTDYTDFFNFFIICVNLRNLRT